MSKLLLPLFLLVSFAVSAQNKPTVKQPSATPITKFRPPVVKTMLGSFSGADAHCTAEEGRQAVNLPLRVVDEKNNSYNITSYQFAYRRVGVKEDEETGEISPAKDMVSRRFTETPLPELWRSNVNETLKTGEELYFFDIIVRDAQGRLFFAPELKIDIQ